MTDRIYLVVLQSVHDATHTSLHTVPSEAATCPEDVAIARECEEYGCVPDDIHVVGILALPKGTKVEQRRWVMQDETV